MQTKMKNCGAIILAGGRSRRMGADKSMLQINGQSFLQILTEKFCISNYPTVVVGPATDLATDPGIIEPKISHDRVVGRAVHLRDRTPDLGPLEGIRVGLEYLHSQVKFAFVCAVDAPLLKLELVEYLFTEIGHYQVIAPVSQSRIFGLSAVYRTELYEEIQNRLMAGLRSVQDAIRAFDAKLVDVEQLRSLDAYLDSLRNVNSPADYAQLLRESN